MNLTSVSRIRVKTVSLVAWLLLLSACSTTPIVIPEKSQETVVRVDEEAVQQYQQGLALQNAGKYKRAMAIYEQLQQTHPTYLGPLANLGVIAVIQERYEDAKQTFQQVIELRPNDKQALNYLGILARKTGEFEQAESYYRQALDIDPDYPDAIRNMGILLDLYRGRLEEALVFYEKYQSLQAEPDPKVKDWIFDTKQRLQEAAE